MRPPFPLDLPTSLSSSSLPSPPVLLSSCPPPSSSRATRVNQLTGDQQRVHLDPRRASPAALSYLFRVLRCCRPGRPRDRAPSASRCGRRSLMACSCIIQELCRRRLVGHETACCYHAGLALRREPLSRAEMRLSRSLSRRLGGAAVAAASLNIS